MQQQRDDNSPSQLPACAACKHQRKKCTQNCVLAPFFPANLKQEFEAVHQVFGVSNVTKALKTLKKDEDKRSAVASIIWEASEWKNNSAGGPFLLYRRALEDIELYKHELELCQSQLEMYKKKEAMFNPPQGPYASGGPYGNGLIVGGGAGTGVGTTVITPSYPTNRSNSMMSHVRHNGYLNFDNSSFLLTHQQQHQSNGFAPRPIPGQYNSLNNGNGNGKIGHYNSINNGNVNNGNGKIFDNSLWENDT